LNFHLITYFLTATTTTILNNVECEEKEKEKEKRRATLGFDMKLL